MPFASLLVLVAPDIFFFPEKDHRILKLTSSDCLFGPSANFKCVVLLYSFSAEKMCWKTNFNSYKTNRPKSVLLVRRTVCYIDKDITSYLNVHLPGINDR